MAQEKEKLEDVTNVNNVSKKKYKFKGKTFYEKRFKLYKEKKLNHKEATVLLSFCNNLSPAYVIGILCSHLERIEKISASPRAYASR